MNYLSDTSIKYSVTILSLITTIFLIITIYIGYAKYNGGYIYVNWIDLIVNILISVALYLISYMMILTTQLTHSNNYL